MIFLCGIPSEPSLGLVIDRLQRIGAPHVVFNQRRFADLEIEMEVSSGIISGRLQLEGDSYRLQDFDAVYTRLMDHRLLPEVEHEAEDSPARRTCRNLHAALTQWYEIAPGRVLNRSHEVGAGYSKPLQAQLIGECGFATPTTIVTNDADAVREFQRTHGRIVYKSASYVRSVVSLVTDGDLARLSALRACPVQFQQFIEGVNLRVHTVAGQTFATSITASSVDYRYAYLEGDTEKLETVTLTGDLGQRCLELAAAFGLEFAGIDLKVAGDGEVYCLEVNPSPAFSYYELHTGQPISRAVAEHLAGAGRDP